MKVFSGISFLPWRNGLIGPKGLDHPWPKGHFQGEEILRVDGGARRTTATPVTLMSRLGKRGILSEAGSDFPSEQNHGEDRGTGVRDTLLCGQSV